MYLYPEEYGLVSDIGPVSNNLSQYATLSMPKNSDWTAAFAGITYTPVEGKEPNWFHRFMQRLCFGIVWSKK